MSLWDSLILGLVQGATEFLPVSSSGHLVVGQLLLGVELPGVVFEVAVHVATLLSVLLVYRRRIAQLVSGTVRGKREAWVYVGLIALATLPAAVVGLVFGDWVESLFENPWVPGVAFLVTGTFLLSTRAALRRNPEPSPVDARRALLIGVSQAVALTPGISRSGATVVMGLWLGLEAREAAAFSFLMSVPAISGAAVLQLPEIASGGWSVAAASLVVGGATAALSGVVAIRVFLVTLSKGSFHGFGWYCWGLGTLLLTYLVLR